MSLGCPDVYTSVRPNVPGAHSHILMTWGPSDLFGPEILAQTDFWVYI